MATNEHAMTPKGQMIWDRFYSGSSAKLQADTLNRAAKLAGNRPIGAKHLFQAQRERLLAQRDDL